MTKGRYNKINRENDVFNIDNAKLHVADELLSLFEHAVRFAGTNIKTEETG